MYKMRMRLKRNYFSYITAVVIISILVLLYLIERRPNTHTDLSDKIAKSEVEYRSIVGHERELFDKELPVTDKEDTTTSYARDDKSNNSLKVYVVEEHHEVIPYWFEAVNNGVIPKTGNTLIHIDGHADLAQPSNVPNYPFFKWPSDKQLKYLMQRNDAFIQATAMAGIIDRFIWVWPAWDHPNHDGRHVSVVLSIGWAYVTSEGHKTTEKTFCMCILVGRESDCTSVENAEIDSYEAEGEGYKIRAENCKSKKHVKVDIVHELKVISLLSSPDWIDSSENIMLDIDEDYYGCEYAIGPLLKSNMTYENINLLDETIAALFCPLSANQEKESDDILMEIIDKVRSQRVCMTDPKLADTLQCQKVLKLDMPQYFESVFNARITERTINLCENVPGVKEIIKYLLQLLGHLRINQLRALQSAGFCSMTSSKTLKMHYNERFGICSGANTPNNTVVIEHVPSEFEINLRTNVLKSMLQKINSYSPQIVTVCRSVRDGYTPRKYFELIETSVLSTLDETIDKKLSIHYDEGLIGGKLGWPAKHNTF